MTPVAIGAHVPSTPVVRQPDSALTEQGERYDAEKTREVFDEFVGTTFYGQMLKSMRQTVGKPPYFHGGRAEEVFQAQLDQVLSERMTEASAESFTEPMFELFQLQRRS